jgi:hypothetical protein
VGFWYATSSLLIVLPKTEADEGWCRAQIMTVWVCTSGRGNIGGAAGRLDLGGLMVISRLNVKIYPSNLMVTDVI